MAALKGNVIVNNKELEALTKVADLFEEIAKDKAVIANQGKLTNNGIQQYADTSPRVEKSQAPTVEQNEIPRVPDRLVVACPPAVFYSNDGPEHPIPPLPNYITREQPEKPIFQRRSKRVTPDHSPKRQF